MTTQKPNFLLLGSALLLILACVVPSAGAPVPTVDPEVINLFIMQTANAAATQTAAALPTSTPTETATPTPRNTETPSPTPTVTFIFILASPTSPFTPTIPFLGVSGSSSDNFACQVISVSPPNGTGFKPRANFDAVWRVKNIGKKDWDQTVVDYTFENGAKLHRIEGYDLTVDVKSGRTTDIAVDMRAPRNPGTYTTNWIMRASRNEFCRLALTINVR